MEQNIALIAINSAFSLIGEMAKPAVRPVQSGCKPHLKCFSLMQVKFLTFAA
jgi:hypothetical protein